MTDLRTYARSFAGGEVTPEFFGRIDDVKNQTGLRTCRNFIVKPHGPATNRGGLMMVRKVKNPAVKTRVIPFVFATDQSLVIELGAGYFRFHTQGGTILSGGVPYEVANPYAESDLAGVKFVQSNDVVTLVHPNHPPAELKRLGTTNWTYSTISFASPLAPPTGVAATATPATTTPGTPTLQSYTVTAVSGQDESAPAANSLSGSVTLTGITKANPGVFSATSFTDPGFTVGDKVYVSGVGGMSEVNGNYYLINSYSFTPPGGGEFPTPGIVSMTLKDVSTGTPLNTSSFSTYSGGGTVALVGAARCSNNLFDTGAYNTISWAAVTGAKRYNVYKLSNGLYGFIGQTENLSFTDDNIAADLSRTPPISETFFGSANNYPSTVGYFEQRRCFANSDMQPANFWATRSGTESNLSYSIPTRDDDSIRFRIAARERSAIRHIVPMADLILLSESAEWRVTPASGEVLTPDVSVRAQSFIGAGAAQPVIVNNNLLFSAARGGHIRELAFNWQAGGYITGDTSLRAPHLFDGAAVLELAYAKAPVPTVWAVSTTGKLLGLTYVPEQEVGAWHRHDTTDGAFESICAVPEGDADVLYAVVARTTSLGTERFVERMAPRQSTDDATGFFVDFGATYSGAPVDEISGLDWLEGKTVAILTDGAVHPKRTVVGGAISLDIPASLVHVGLEIEADIETLPLAFEAQGYGQGRPKNVSEVWLRVFASRGIFAGPSFDKLTEHKPRTTEVYGAPPNFITDEIRLAITPTWSNDGKVCLRHSDPLPFTLVSMTLGLSAGG
ncbi:hypothetical protein BSL82_10170 [Tardibacter chloracetimidivorans]|uniref:Ubiquitin-activating enzyme E1 FCCH domain-containing protein n=1 Tax=Tardibacter chloracetimidivorans TaxID=1921510 RepID=A0A1L3ZVI0_9SPHN|nr:hypothetical protein [Tardibacter chloracetimidivorans]API59638.1 hypothetical protein BSL82_10170 [Tardibacter chloracetimidivorans]